MLRSSFLTCVQGCLCLIVDAVLAPSLPILQRSSLLGKSSASTSNRFRLSEHRHLPESVALPMFGSSSVTCMLFLLLTPHLMRCLLTPRCIMFVSRYAFLVNSVVCSNQGVWWGYEIRTTACGAWNRQRQL